MSRNIVGPVFDISNPTGMTCGVAHPPSSPDGRCLVCDLMIIWTNPIPSTVNQERLKLTEKGGV